jgi:hypothetical protein
MRFSWAFTQRINIWLLQSMLNALPLGCSRGEDEKKGCTLAVTCEMFSSRQSTRRTPSRRTYGSISDYGWRSYGTGCLSRRYNEWNGPATIKFQAKNWMDNPTWKFGPLG